MGFRSQGFARQVKKIIRRWASYEHISPLAFVRRCMKGMSRVARQLTSAPTVMWNADHTKIMVQNYTVTISQYIQEVQNSLSALAEKVDRDVLCGIKFPSGSFSLPDDALETNDMDTQGVGLFSPSTDSDSAEILAVNYHSATFFLQKLCETGCLCQHDGEEIRWNAVQVNEWLLCISEVWSETLTLMHLLALPGRGTEVSGWQYANSITSSRHLFLSSTLGTLFTLSNYNKTTAITGQHKHILRVIPHALSLIITKLLRIVRPIETLALTSLSIGETSNTQAVYRTYMFVSHGEVWDSGVLSACLRRWFSRHLKVPFGLHLHRHFAQALQRHFLSYENETELAKVANEVLGHGLEVASHHYAREAEDLCLDSNIRRRMEKVGSDWIRKVHRIEVSPRLDRKGKARAL